MVRALKGELMRLTKTLCFGLTFILAMLHHPEVAAQAQREIDLVTGSLRLPCIEDRDSLPYIDCIVKEVLRINPPAPLGLSSSFLVANRNY